MGEYIVYKHTNKINKKVYIGLTRQKPSLRWKGGSGYKPKTIGTTSYIYNAILKYGWDNFSHEILLVGLTKEEAEKAEIELIAKYKSDQREFGYNLDKGGNSTGKMSEETIQKLRDIHKDKAANAERYRKISESKKGVKLSEKHRQNLSQAKKGKYTGKNNPSAKAINQYSLDMEFIKAWDCMEGASSTLGICKANICRAIKYDRTAGGYRWRYA
ncbi:MAG: GIY-YIG nuclease family protein [Clostridia bacterium]|nr:GIY-YIG nuclease family protein [Clostridia bacterium]